MVALVQHVSGTTTSSGVATITLASTGSGNALIVAASYNQTSDTDLASITLGGSGTGFASQSWHAGVSAFNNSVWANYSIASGQTTLVVTGGSGTTDMSVDVFEVSGGLTAMDVSPVWHEVDNTTGTWTSGASGSTSQAIEFILGLVSGYNSGSGSVTLTGPASPWVNESQLTPATGLGQVAGYQISSSAGTFTYSGTATGFTGTNFVYQAGVLTFKTAGASVTSTGSVAVPAMTVGGSVNVPQPVTSSGSVAMPAMAVSGSVAMPVTASGSVAMPALGVIGVEIPYPWTTNYCPNPSFETDLAGWTALTGTTLLQDATQGFAGHNSMQVETDGSVSGEGIYGPSVTVPATGTGSMSLYLMGPAGNLTVSAVSGATATIIASTNVTLTGGDYQRVILNGLALTGGQPMYVVVQTTTAQTMSFWVDAVQYEMGSPAHPYIDGNVIHCQWEGVVNESASFQPYPFMTSAAGGMFLEGHATPVAQGEVYLTSAEGGMLLSGTESGTTVGSPAGALTDFGIWTPADMDPAVSYAGWSNAQSSTGQTTWNRLYGMYTAPQAYPVSGGQTLWQRAAYAAFGWDFKAIPAGYQQSVADVQAEVLPITPGASPAPTTWTPPRQVSTVIKPTRLNFVPNPSIEISTADWTTIGSAVLSQDNSVTAVSGLYSLKVTLHASGDGCYIAIPDLIVGDTYVFSAAVQAGAGLEDVTVSCSGASVSTAQQGIPYGGDAILGIGYGQGPYGGVEAGTSDMPTAEWFMPSSVFTAAESTVILAFQSVPGSDVSYPTEFWVDAVLVEVGETVNPYFDGSYGTDYSWETGGTAGLTRSYYYERMEVTTGAVNDVLSQHTPLGITAAAPTFSSPYTQ